MKALSLRSDAGRAGKAKTPSPDAEGRVRLRDPGFNWCEEFSPTLDATQVHTVCVGNEIRRLTPLECERLQGFTDAYTDVHYKSSRPSSSMRCKAVGNAMAVNCMRWLGERIQEADKGVPISVRLANTGSEQQ
jgi:site-specific DNA-cytosine methylase